MPNFKFMVDFDINLKKLNFNSHNELKLKRIKPSENRHKYIYKDKSIDLNTEEKLVRGNSTQQS